MWGGCCLQEIFRYAPCVFSEIFDEKVGELVGHCVVSEWVRPGLARVEQCLRNARAAVRYTHSEDGMGGIAGVVEVAIEGGGDHGPGQGEFDTFTVTVATAGPAGIDHPHFYSVAGDLFAEQSGITAGVQG